MSPRLQHWVSVVTLTACLVTGGWAAHTVSVWAEDIPIDFVPRFWRLPTLFDVMGYPGSAAWDEQGPGQEPTAPDAPSNSTNQANHPTHSWRGTSQTNH